jgi:hypothetical protein
MLTRPLIQLPQKEKNCTAPKWHRGTGPIFFLTRFKNLRENSGGYFSYPNKDLTTCIFFSKEDSPKVLCEISFDSAYDVKTARVSGTAREFTVIEKDLYAIRKTALKELNTDTLFKRYKNMNFNIIPFIDGGQKKVYVLTGPEATGVVVSGNDSFIGFQQRQ